MSVADFLRTRKPIAIGDRKNFETRFRSLLELRANRLVNNPSPAAMQLTLLSKPELDFSADGKAAQTRVGGSLVQFQYELGLAATQLGERLSDTNRFEQRLPHVYSLLLTYGVLHLLALKPERPLTHAGCTALWKSIAESNLAARLVDINQVMQGLVDKFVMSPLLRAPYVAQYRDYAQQAVDLIAQMLRPTVERASAPPNSDLERNPATASPLSTGAESAGAVAPPVSPSRTAVPLAAPISPPTVGGAPATDSAAPAANPVDAAVSPVSAPSTLPPTSVVSALTPDALPIAEPTAGNAQPPPVASIAVPSAPPLEFGLGQDDDLIT